MQDEPNPQAESTETPDRRGLFSRANTLVMAAGLAASYGTFAYMAGRFLYPAKGRSRAWVYVCRAEDLTEGKSIKFQTPSGEKINVARVGEEDSVESFIALSSTCPHLGCQVHWEPNKNRFFCPCHNGVFSPDGTATGGPPADAGQKLEQKPLEVRNGLIYMHVETERLADAGISDSGVLETTEHPRGSGHDPCLAPPEPVRNTPEVG